MATEPRFDADKNHAIVSPPSEGVFYYQQPFYFRADGSLVHELLDDAGHARLAELDAAEAAAVLAQEEAARIEAEANAAAAAAAPPAAGAAPAEPEPETGALPIQDEI